jgi:hypothetical protein
MNTRPMKTTMGSLLFACALASLVAAAMTFGTSSVARAEGGGQSCSVQTLRGSYVFAAQGFNIVGGVAVPKAIIEGINFNGDGTLSSPFATVSINGTILHFGGGTGSYTVNPDCTGTLTFSMGISFDIFVEPRGRQLWMIQTGPAAPPTVFQGTATRVFPPASR